jgi:hypothetical protein
MVRENKPTQGELYTSRSQKYKCLEFRREDPESRPVNRQRDSNCCCLAASLGCLGTSMALAAGVVGAAYLTYEYFF